MAKWRGKAQKNLLNLSSEQENHLLAAKEWEFLGVVIDHGNTSNLCELCEGENLRYHYQIFNTNNQSSLWVGSSCIHKFAIVMKDDDGTVIEGDKERKKHLVKKIEKKKRENFLEDLRSFWRKANGDSKSIIQQIGEYLKDNLDIPPNLIVNFLYVLEEEKYNIDLSFLKINTRSNYQIELIAKEPQDTRRLIYKLLSDQQIEKVEKRITELASIRKRELEHDKYLDNLSYRKIQRQNTIKPPQPSRDDIFKMPELIICSRCGESTENWAMLNPDVCSRCLRGR